MNTPEKVLDEETLMRIAYEFEGIKVVNYTLPGDYLCEQYDHVFREAAENFPQHKFFEVNVKQTPTLAKHAEVVSVPTLMIYLEDDLLVVKEGTMPFSELEALIADVEEFAATR